MDPRKVLISNTFVSINFVLSQRIIIIAGTIVIVEIHRQTMAEAMGASIVTAIHAMVAATAVTHSGARIVRRWTAVTAAPASVSSRFV